MCKSRSKTLRQRPTVREVRFKGCPLWEIRSLHFHSLCTSFVKPSGRKSRFSKHGNWFGVAHQHEVVWRRKHGTQGCLGGRRPLG